MNNEYYWNLFSKTGKIQDYLKYVENKKLFSGVNDGEVLSGSTGDKGNEYR